MSFIDAIVVVLLLGAAWSGFRRGFIATTISLIGGLGGAIVAIRLAPLAMQRVDDSAAKVAIGICCIVVGVGIGEVAGSTVGRILSEKVTYTPGRAVDRGLGLVGHTLAVMIIIWLVAIPVASVPYPWLASAVRSSAIITGVNKVMPDSVRHLSDRMRELFDDSGFPAILDPLATTPDAQVDPPDQSILSDPQVRAARSSVLKIEGSAPGCSRRIEGSGWVIGPGRLMTNAHVVAGTSSVVVLQGTKELTATVVLYNPQVDLAVLVVPGMTAKPLDLQTAAQDTGASAVALGYPLDGPYTATAARVREDFSLRGPDIYNATTVTRQVYSLRAVIRAGNSGGPLLDDAGQVVGVIFGASIDKPDVGFALTASQVQPTLQAGLVDSSPAETGSCTAD